MTRARRKIFGMIAVPLDRNDKARLLFRARALMRATEKGKAYGAVSAKAYGVLCALLMQLRSPAAVSPRTIAFARPLAAVGRRWRRGPWPRSRRRAS